MSLENPSLTDWAFCLLTLPLVGDSAPDPREPTLLGRLSVDPQATQHRRYRQPLGERLLEIQRTMIRKQITGLCRFPSHKNFLGIRGPLFKLLKVSREGEHTQSRRMKM